MFVLVLVLLAPSSWASAQTTDAQVSAQEAALVQSVQTTIQSLRASLSLVLSQGDSEQQVGLWRQQNAALLQSMIDNSQLLAAYDYFTPKDYISEITVPQGASQQLSDFLLARANLLNNQAQIHNQLIQGVSQISVETSQQLQEQENELFLQQNHEALHALEQQAVALAETAQRQPEVAPDTMVIPAGTSPQLQAYLTLRDELVREEVQIHNQYCAGDLDQMQAALDQWKTTNADRFQQLRQLAISLAPPATTTSDTSTSESTNP